jgi:hypothetical protein
MSFSPHLMNEVPISLCRKAGSIFIGALLEGDNP